MAENRELDALDVQSTKGTHPEPQAPGRGIKNMALTFGTLLRSQGADARRTRPRGPRRRRLVPRYAVHGSLSHPEICPAAPGPLGPVSLGAERKLRGRLGPVKRIGPRNAPGRAG